jgi:hypothetical protein
MTKKEQILAEIDTLIADALVETNEGTHGGPDNYRVYERLDGTRYTVGPGSARSAGRPRRIAHRGAAARRAGVAALREALAAIDRDEEALEGRKADLARGWDGYRFVGREKAGEILEAL